MIAQEYECCEDRLTPRQALMREHRVIERVLDAMERMVWSDAIDGDFVRQALDFCRQFADGLHHAKEEQELFPVLESAGIARDGGPIGCMLFEHDEGRALLSEIERRLTSAQTDPVSAESLRRAVSCYVALLRQHIRKEDNVLFAMADQVLGPEEQKLMLAAFDRAEQNKGGAARRDRYVQLADELSRWEFAKPTPTA